MRRRRDADDADEEKDVFEDGQGFKESDDEDSYVTATPLAEENFAISSVPNKNSVSVASYDMATASEEAAVDAIEKDFAKMRISEIEGVNPEGQDGKTENDNDAGSQGRGRNDEVYWKEGGLFLLNGVYCRALSCLP